MDMEKKTPSAFRKVFNLLGKNKAGFATALLLCADVTGKAQKALLRSLPPELLRADVVKAPHHGLTPFVSEFLDAVEPQMIVVTNTPRRAPKLAGQAKHRQLPLYFSGAQTLVLETDGVNWTVREEKP